MKFRLKRRGNAPARQGGSSDGDTPPSARADEDRSSQGIGSALHRQKKEPEVFLHGKMHIKIHRAKRLVDKDCIGKCGQNPVTAGLAKLFSLPCCPRLPVSDPYVNVYLGPDRVCKTRFIPNDLNPVWEEEFLVNVAHEVDEVVFRVKDKDMFGADKLGVGSISAAELVKNGHITSWLKLRKEHRRKRRHHYTRLGQLCVEVEYIPLDNDPTLQSPDVPDTYFEPQDGCRLTLYEDACNSEKILPPIPLSDRVQQHRCCWRDIQDTILKAQHFIYIAGWSVDTKIQLVREEGQPTLKELLDGRAREGVTVLIMIWDDATSLSTPFFTTAGIMDTKCEETYLAFKDSPVEVAKVPRIGSDADSNTNNFFKELATLGLFTHHQKLVAADEPSAMSGKHRIVAYVGGLDLCGMRYDTPEHGLFKGRDTVEFRDDFFNHIVPADSIGPRQPWHDAHSRVEGPAALDVVRNFTERWKAQVRDKVDMLVDLDSDKFYLGSKAAVNSSTDPDRWRMQVLRSIDERSAVLDTSVGPLRLHHKKGRRVDNSIYRGYVHAIRRADQFLYIENQYFLGGSHLWDTDYHVDCSHIVPIEIAEKVCQKIRQHQPFVAYVVVPMFCEGNPTSRTVQEILHWQTQTLKMMYKRIATTLQETGTDSWPTDYLKFFCLGKREPEEEHQSSSQSDTTLESRTAAGSKLPTENAPDSPDNDTVMEVSNTLELISMTRRFLIYVHSKLLIVDDQCVIVGSANINARSLYGTRDTEIAVMAYQPEHMMKPGDSEPPKGAIHAYRMSLWAEHFGAIHDEFHQPSSAACAATVSTLAANNWEKYAGDEVVPLDGYMMKYPLQINKDGTVESIPGHEEFVDVGGRVMGENTVLPDIATT